MIISFKLFILLIVRSGRRIRITLNVLRFIPEPIY
jgi:hypothetical protein